MKRQSAPRYEWVEQWGENVKEKREERGWSADELATKVEVTRTTIFRIERGDLNPNEALKARLANVFGVRMDKLFAYPAVIPSWYGADRQPIEAAS